MDITLISNLVIGLAISLVIVLLIALRNASMISVMRHNIKYGLMFQKKVYIDSFDRRFDRNDSEHVEIAKIFRGDIQRIQEEISAIKDKIGDSSDD